MATGGVPQKRYLPSHTQRVQTPDYKMKISKRAVPHIGFLFHPTQKAAQTSNYR